MQPLFLALPPGLGDLRADLSYWLVYRRSTITTCIMWMME